MYEDTAWREFMPTVKQYAFLAEKLAAGHIPVCPRFYAADLGHLPLSQGGVRPNLEPLLSCSICATPAAIRGGSSS